MSCNGTNGHWINKIREVRKQEYICPECKYSYVTELDFMPKGCNYTLQVQEEGLKQGLIEYKSLEKTAETIGQIYGHEPSRQTVLNHMNAHSEKYLGKIEKEIDEKIKEEKIEFSGVYNYDEQYTYHQWRVNTKINYIGQ
jgi:transposase-like protein